MNKNRLYLLLLVSIFLLFFYKTLFFGLLPIPTDTLVGLYHPWRDLYAQTNPRGVPFKNFLITDPIRQQIPWRKLVIDSWKTGNIPSFNPYNAAGAPLDANIQAAPFYPLNILFLFFQFKYAWTMLIILQPVLGGLFLYIFLRNKNLSNVSAIVGSVCWGLSGFSIAWLTWGTLVHTALWLPLLLYALDRKKILIGTISLIMAFTAGHAQIALYVASFAFFYAYWSKSLRLYFAMFALSLIITLPQWIPFVSFVQNTQRITADALWKSPGFFMPWYHLIQFLAPDFFGNPSTLNYWGEWNYGEMVGYIGFIPLLFALSVFLQKGITKFFSLSILVSLFLIVSSVVSSIPFQLQIPIISILQPTRLLFIVDFSLAILAAFGFEYWLRNKNRNITKIIITVSVILLILWIFVVFDKTEQSIVARRNLLFPTLLCISGILIYVKRKYAIIVMISVIVFDLFRFGWKFTPYTPKEYFFPTSTIISFLQQQQKPFRVMSLDDRLTAPNTLSYYGIESIEGYDPIVSKEFSQLANEIEGKKDFNRIYLFHNLSNPIVQNLNIRYILSLEERSEPYLEEIMREGQTILYQLRDWSPRFYFSDHSNDQLAIVKYTENAVSLSVHTTSERELIFSNMFDTRWRVSIDNNSVEIYKANNYFIAINVPSGNHVINFRYE